MGSVYVVFAIANDLDGVVDAPFAGIFDDVEKAEKLVAKARELYPLYHFYIETVGLNESFIDGVDV